MISKGAPIRESSQHTLLALGFGLNRSATLLGSYTAFGLVLGNHGFVTSVDFMVAKAIGGALVAFIATALIFARKIQCQAIPVLPSTVLFTAFFAVGVFSPEWLVRESWFRIALGLGSGAISSTLSLIWFEQLLRGPFIKSMVGGCFLSSVIVFLAQQLSLVAILIISIACAVSSNVIVARMRRTIPFADFAADDKPRSRHLKTLFSRDYVQALLCILVSVFVVGAMHTAVFDSESMGVIADVSMGLVTFVACCLVAAFIFFAAGVPNPLLVYKVCLPVMLAIFSLMPFTAGILGSYAGFVMNVCYAVIAIAFQAFVIEYSWKKKRFDGANYGFYLGTSNIILFFGLLVGQALNVLSSSQGVSIFMLLAFVGIYPLGIILVFALTRSKPQASPEVSAEQGFSAEQYVETFGASASAGGSASTSPVEEDVLRLERFAGKYNLTKRETEIVSFLVKGRAVKHIANSLYLSENTVWTHVKGAYSKTGVHSKEELIELFEHES